MSTTQYSKYAIKNKIYQISQQTDKKNQRTHIVFKNSSEDK